MRSTRDHVRSREMTREVGSRDESTLSTQEAHGKARHTATPCGLRTEAASLKASRMLGSVSTHRARSKYALFAPLSTPPRRRHMPERRGHARKHLFHGHEPGTTSTCELCKTQRQQSRPRLPSAMRGRRRQSPPRGRGRQRGRRPGRGRRGGRSVGARYRFTYGVR